MTNDTVLHQKLDVRHDAIIPTYVQKSLGMQNLQQQKHQQLSSDDDNIICGLEGFLLPQYITLRVGISSRLPEALVQAQEEEAHHRHRRCSRRNDDCKAINKSNDGSSRNGTRKRKRKADHNYNIPSSHDGAAATGEGDIDADADADADGIHLKGTTAARRRKKMRKRKQDNLDDNASQNVKRSSSDDWIHYQMMARMIIAPYTTNLIATMNICKQGEKGQEENKNQTTQSSTGAKIDTDVAVPPPQTSLQEVDATSKPSHSVLAKKQSTSQAKNIYQKKPKTESKSKNFLSISPPQESLESIVDGAVCTLVRRTHRFRSQSSYMPFGKVGGISSGGNRNEQLRKPVYRRRHRRGKQNHQHENGTMSKEPKPNGTATKQSTTENKEAKPDTSSANNNWLLEQNLLSTGYTLGNGDTLTSFPSRSTNNNNNNSQHQKAKTHSQFLRGCPNMAPGIHCIHPNTLTSYARSSELMRLLHSLVGDDMIREMLMNCVILVPAISSPSSSKTTKATLAEKPGTNTSSSSSPPSSSVSVFERGNYFQLCGPPLNVLAKKFDGMTKSLATATKMHDSSCRKRKRIDQDNESSSKKTSTLSKGSSSTKGSYSHTHNSISGKTKPWDPNRPIPRGNLFYCDFYAKHVGLFPRHLLNQSDASDSKDTSKFCLNLDVNAKLLNAMVQIWPTIRGRTANRNDRRDKPCILHCNKRRGRWRRLRESGIAMCREMRRRHGQCDYARSLDQHCPLPKASVASQSKSEGINVMDEKAALSHYVTLYTPAECVGTFLGAILWQAFPASFWGSQRNFLKVVQTVKVFVQLGRTEQLPEKAIVDGIRILDMKWLHPNSVELSSTKRPKSKVQQKRQRPKLSRSGHESTTVLVRNIMRWLYSQFIIPLLRSTFYITETEFTGSRVVYYRKPVWSRIRKYSFRLLFKQQYRELDAAKAQRLLSSHNVGCPPAPLRLLPKKTGIRAIAMLSKSCSMESIIGSSSKMGDTTYDPKAGLKSAPPNKVLQSTFHALKYEHEKKPSMFGAGVLGLTEVFPSYCLFIEALGKKWPNFRSLSAETQNTGGSLYFASADIKHCYDTINQKYLWKLMKAAVVEDVYITKNNFILHTKENDSSLRCLWKKSTFGPDKFSQFLSTSNAFADKYFNSIFVEGIQCSMEEKARINGLLRDHIFGQVVVTKGSHGYRYLLQKDGIPQVCVLTIILAE